MQILLGLGNYWLIVSRLWRRLLVRKSRKNPVPRPDIFRTFSTKACSWDASKVSQNALFRRYRTGRGSREGAPRCALRKPPETLLCFFVRSYFWSRTQNEIKTGIYIKSVLGRPSGGTPEAPSRDLIRCRYHSQEHTLAHFGRVSEAHFLT